MFAIAKKLIAELQSVSERLESLRNGIKEHTEAIHAKYDKAEDDRKKEGDRQYTVQNSLRWATWCAVGAAVIYAGVSAWQTGEIRHNFRMDQRAWMKITPDSTPNVNTNPALWIARYSDVGKTPARKVAAEFQFQFLKKGEFPIFDYKTVPIAEAYQPLMYVGDEQTIPVIRAYYANGSKQRVDTGLSTEELDLLKNGEAWIAKNGRMTYEDVFGVKHVTTFCAYSTVTTLDVRKRQEFPGMHACTEYNSVDNNW